MSTIKAKGRPFLIPLDVIEACVKEYSETNISIPNLSKKFNVSYGNLKYALKNNGCIIEKRGNGHLGLTRTVETKSNISAAKLGKPNFLKRGSKYSAKQRLHIISGMLKTSEDLSEFESDVDKFLLLKELAIRSIPNKNNSEIIKFVKYFFTDLRFNKIYDHWKKTNNKLAKPSVDHILPISRGGSSDLSNFQMLTWFENRTKNNMTDEEWLEFKKKTNTRSDLFIR